MNQMNAAEYARSMGGLRAQPDSLVVAIGRNVGRQPMRQASWLRYLNATQDILLDAGAVIRFSGQGEGEYELVSEASAAWIATITGELRMDLLARDLSQLAMTNGQDYIAVIRGTVELVEGITAVRRTG